MQRGHFYRPIGARHLRYRNGKQVSVKLADYTDEYRTLKSVRPRGEPYLQLANLESKCVSARLANTQTAIKFKPVPRTRH